MVIWLVVKLIKLLKNWPRTQSKVAIAVIPSTPPKDPQLDLDAEHYKRQLDLYYEMLWEAEDYLEKARVNLKQDRMLNKYGAVVQDKAYEQHRKEYQKWLSKVAIINNKIHTTERKLNKCM